MVNCTAPLEEKSQEKYSVYSYLRWSLAIIVTVVGVMDPSVFIFIYNYKKGMYLLIDDIIRTRRDSALVPNLIVIRRRKVFIYFKCRRMSV